MSAEAISVQKTQGTRARVQREDRLFCVFAILFFAAWTIVPTLFLGNYRPDVIEQSFVGQEWVFGTAKHPSLTAVVLEIASLGLLRASFVPYFVSQLFVLVTMISIWCLAKDIMSKPLALAATCAMFNYWFFHFESTLYNNNTTLNASWAVSTVLCWYAFKSNKLFYWIAAGIAIGTGLHFKYTMAVFAMVVVLFLLCDSHGRKLWLKPGPWLTTLTALLVFLPHMIWVIQHDYVTLQYASHLAQKTGWAGHVTQPLDFVVGQLGYIVPLLIPLIPICGWIGRIDRAKFCKTFQERYLLVVWAAPFLFQVVLSAWKGLSIRGALGCHIWLFFTVYLVYTLKSDASPVKIARSIRISLAMQIAILMLSVALVAAAPFLTGRGSRYHFPGKALATHVEHAWHERCDCSLPWVTGEWWLAGNACVYGKDRASVYCTPGANSFVNGRPFSTWGTIEDVNRDGCMILWRIPGPDPKEQVPPALREYFPKANVLAPIVIPWQTKAPIPPLKIGMAIVFPTERRQNKR